MSTLTSSESAKKVAKDSAEFIAMLLVYLSKAIVEKLGEEPGEKVLRKGLREFGKARGKKIRKKIDSLNLKPSIENFTKYYDFPMFAAFKATREMSKYKKIAKISFCPLANFWEKCDEKKIGLLYCEEVDDGIREGFDSKLIHKNTQNPLKGDKICEHIDSYYNE